MGATILVADDEPAIRDLLAVLLEAAGHRVLRAADGEEALALLVGARPDLLITDHAMPGPTGLDLIDYLRAHPALAVPVILLSATARGPARAPTVLLAKPFDVDQLLGAVAALLA